MHSAISNLRILGRIFNFNVRSFNFRELVFTLRFLRFLLGLVSFANRFFYLLDLRGIHHFTRLDFFYARVLVDYLSNRYFSASGTHASSKFKRGLRSTSVL